MLFVVGDLTLQLLHMLLALQKLMELHRPNATLSVLMVPLVILQSVTRGLHLQSAAVPPPAASPPACDPLVMKGRRPLMRLHFCARWAEAAAAPNVFALFILSLTTDVMESACENRPVVAAKLLQSFPGAQLFPPLSWDDLLERKDVIYQRFGPAFMLPAAWFAVPTLQSVEHVAAQMLAGRADGRWMIKGSFSYGGLTCHSVQIKGGACAQLQQVLTTLYTQEHQRSIGIQPYEQGLHDFELRAYLVRDPRLDVGWRPAVFVRTHILQHNDFSSFEAEQMQPVYGRSLEIAGFIDNLLSAHKDFFKQAVKLELPLLRLDCSYSPSLRRSFLSEMCPAGPAVLFTHVHAQELAVVAGRGLAQGLWRLLPVAPAAQAT